MRGLVAVLLLVVLRGFFSAAKSAIINLRQTRINQLLDEDRDKAEVVAQLAEGSTHLLAGFQLWIALTNTLATGVAVLTLVSPLESVLAQVSVLEPISAPLGAGIVILGVAGVLLIAGNLVPEAVGAANAERLAFMVARPVAALMLLVWPVVRLVVRVSNRLSVWMGGEPLRAMPFITEEEIMTMVDAGQEVGLIEEDEKEMIYSVFALGNTLAREVMVPRIDIVALDVETSLEAALDVAIRAGHSRIPTFEHTIDNIVGVLYAKDLLQLWRDKREMVTLRDELRTPYFVPESKPVDELLEEMQQRKVHMVIVVDEYGGTAGLVTLEDIVEEIVGEIQDEYDAEEPVVEQVSDGEFVFNARVDLDDVNRLMGTSFPTEMGDTLGGFIYSQLGKVPVAGETIRFDGLIIQVLTVSGRRIRKVRVCWERSRKCEEGESNVA
jgi:CBS domain containing-hemolysin-like protein